MNFIFADNADLVDPNYDFIKDRSPPDREPYWDDVYPHELLGKSPYDGILVSIAAFGSKIKSGSYSVGQMIRFKNVGVRKFFRFEEEKYPNTQTWGDCGAFTYVREEYPPYTVDDIIEYYALGQFSHGCSLDHIIFEFYDTEFLLDFDDKEPKRRQEITLSNAAEFITKTKKRIGEKFTPVGVVHGWTPKTMASAAKELVKMGYKYIALGGMVPLAAKQIKSALIAIREVIPSEIKVHILGFAKPDNIKEFSNLKLNSVDTTSPLLRAFKDKNRNYFLNHNGEIKYYSALRVPQALDNNSLKKLVQSGEINFEDTVKYERAVLKEIRLFGGGGSNISHVTQAMLDYMQLMYKDKSRNSKLNVGNELVKLSNSCIETLEARPWEKCGCKICKDIGVEVIIFRGNNRNRRRGFHNLHTYKKHVTEMTS